MQSNGEWLAKKEQELLAYDGPDRVVTSTEKRRQLADESPPSLKFLTGITGLDHLVDGVCGGELIAIGGPRKHGKTLLMQSLTANFVKQKAKVIWFSFEVPTPQFLTQMPENVEFLLPNTLFPYKVDWVIDRVWEAKLKYGAQIVAVDNLHHMFDISLTQGPVSLMIGNIIRGLKQLAIKLNIIVFILCHSKKPQSSTDGEEAEVSDHDMRDSSIIPSECDTTWMIRRCFESSEAVLKVACHRRTGVLGNKISLFKNGFFLQGQEGEFMPQLEDELPF